MTYNYLKKKLVTNIPMILTLKKRLEPKEELDYTTKNPTGKMQYPYIMVTMGGEELWHYAKDYEETTLKLFEPGDEVQIVRQEKMSNDGKRYAIMVWTPVGGAEADAAANPQMYSNTSEDRMKKEKGERETQEKIKQVMISLAGLCQAHISAGKTNGEALQLAVEARKLILEKAIQLVQE